MSQTIEKENEIETQDLLAGLNVAIQKSQEYFLRHQYSDGYWWGELESNPTMEAEYLLLTHFLGVADRERWRKLVNYIRSKQRADGSWGQYYEAPGDISTSTECYFALKLAGVSAEEHSMKKAKEFILSKGGVPKTRIFTKIWLALFGQWDWRGVPVMTPEIMFIPKGLPFNIYEFASWARATIVPMTILLTKKPTCPVPNYANIDELYPKPKHLLDYSLPRPKKIIGWRNFFYLADLNLRTIERTPLKPRRVQALKKAEEWIVSHQEADGSWGGIQPPWVYSLMALHSLGYRTDHPVIAKGLKGFEDFAIEDGDTWRVQACISPLWDTCLAMIGLLDSGLPPDHPALVKAGRFLINKQILKKGDWHEKNPKLPPGGWAFEFYNDNYPDIDDAAEILMALNGIRVPEEANRGEAISRGVEWLLGMQSKNGGWGAFDKDNTKTYLAKIPFSDFGESLDPPSVDVTAHALELLGRLGYKEKFPPVRKALKYILREQEPDGCWFGRWGVNYIYGTGAVLPALEAIGYDMTQESVRRAVQWVVAHQNPDGGWGESCASYVDPAYRGRGPSTPSQTAWALIALLSARDGEHPAVSKGVQYLIDTQMEDGNWDEPYFTGAGFPGYGVGKRLGRYPSPGDDGFQGTDLSAGFMINYHMYRNYWPLMALGRFKKTMEKRR